MLLSQKPLTDDFKGILRGISPFSSLIHNSISLKPFSVITKEDLKRFSFFSVSVIVLVISIQPHFCNSSITRYIFCLDIFNFFATSYTVKIVFQSFFYCPHYCPFTVRNILNLLSIYCPEGLTKLFSCFIIINVNE